MDDISTPDGRTKAQAPASPARTPRVHLFCPECGQPNSIKAMMPVMLEPDINEITHYCANCGTETKVQLKTR